MGKYSIAEKVIYKYIPSCYNQENNKSIINCNKWADINKK